LIDLLRDRLVGDILCVFVAPLHNHFHRFLMLVREQILTSGLSFCPGALRVCQLLITGLALTRNQLPLLRSGYGTIVPNTPALLARSSSPLLRKRRRWRLLACDKLMEMS
jgi:hypothetical protein